MTLAFKVSSQIDTSKFLPLVFARFYSRDITYPFWFKFGHFVQSEDGVEPDFLGYFYVLDESNEDGDHFGQTSVTSSLQSQNLRGGASLGQLGVDQL